MRRQEFVDDSLFCLEAILAASVLV